ncbi:DUF3313 domain-containing protein [Pseudomonas syringae]|uniref:DUF3313 domain-containing protein n=1 Tax=Pseudomonas syringae TaxID=317 RepID=UPI003F74D9B6
MRADKDSKVGMLLLLVMALAGCASREPFPYAGIESAPKMRPNKDATSDREPFAYKTQVNWSQFTNVMLEPMSVYCGADNQFADATSEDKRDLANYMTVKFSEALGARFRFVSKPIPYTLRIRLTLTGVETTTPVLATFSRFDVGMGSYNLVQAARDREGSFSGSVSNVVEIYDASTSLLLESYVSRQYPGVYDNSSTFGGFTAARSGIEIGARSLVDTLAGKNNS